MDVGVRQGAATSHSRCCGEVFQRGQASNDAVLCFVIYGADHSVTDCGVGMRVDYYQGRGRVRSHGGVLLWLTAMSWLAGCGGGGSPDSPSNDSPEKSQVNTAPVFTSGHSVSVPESSTVVTRVTAGDSQGDPVTYRLAGGIDADLFDIDTQSGELRFKQPVDFEAPADSNRNNVYVVAVAASDGDKTAWQALDVSVAGLALTVEVKPDFIKTLRFDWTPLKDATYYKLFVNADSESGYTQVGEDIIATPINVTIPVHLTDWVNRLYLVEGHNDQGLVFRSDPKALRTLMLDSIGYVKASNTDANDVFGLSVNGCEKARKNGGKREQTRASGG